MAEQENGQIPGIAPNILSERLNRLEREGLLIARPYSERPPRPPTS
jgi:DNA-binding HxlR family transcriptional regulator